MPEQCPTIVLVLCRLPSSKQITAEFLTRKSLRVYTRASSSRLDLSAYFKEKPTSTLLEETFHVMYLTHCGITPVSVSTLI